MLDFKVHGTSNERRASKIQLDVINSKDIAIIGVSLKMSLGSTVEEFWSNLRQGVDCIGEIPKARLYDIEKYLKYKNILDAEFATASYIDEIDKFDYEFFKISPREAALIDPNQRLFLQVAWNAIEDAGYGGNKLLGTKTGTYVGFEGSKEYSRYIREIDPDSVALSITGNLDPIIASRISYYMDWKGPSVLINTTCSSSLVAVHYACKGIRNGECDLAIAGGVSFSLMPVKSNYRIGIESSDNRTKTFDDNSNGTGGGEGLAAILLKPLSKALEDGDSIYAVIKGGAINHDGNSNGLTAPNPLAQADVIRSAWKDADIDPETITYIEAHGTGTKLGDPIEIEGITKAFRSYTHKKQFCAVGSIKTNIGHLGGSSGIAGLLKAVVALKYKELPPSLHFSNPNRNINFVESPVYVSNSLSSWETDGFPRRCGVSSFGLSGTNCHVVLEEAPMDDRKVYTCDELSLLTISAKNENVLKKLIENYICFFDKNKDIAVKSLCYTANTGRGHYSHRVAVIFNSIDELMQKLSYTDTITGMHEGIFYGNHKKAAENGKKNGAGESMREDIELYSNKANKLLHEFVNGNRKDLKALIEICGLYTSGGNVDWKILYKEGCKRINLPGYPFERKRCWLEIPCIPKGKTSSDGQNLFYKTYWKRKNNTEERRNFAGEVILIFSDEKGFADSLAEKLAEEGARVIYVCSSNEFRVINSDRYMLSESEEDYVKLFNLVKDEKLSRILHMTSIVKNNNVTSVEEMEGLLSKGVYSLLYLIKAIVKVGIRYALEINVLSEFINEVTSRESKINAHNAMLAGFGKVIGKEYQNIRCRVLDVDDDIVVEDILHEISRGDIANHVAFREGKRYVEYYGEEDLTKIDDDKITFKNQGVYIITGGLGGLGLEFGKYLAGKGNVNIALINRSSIHESMFWDNILKEGINKREIKRIKAVLDMQKAHSNILLYNADVSDEISMSRIITELKGKFGKINGIFHAAGVAGDGLIFKKDISTFKNVIKPKVRGTYLLDKLTQNDNLDFFVLFSSLTTVIGAAGQSDYCAANSFMDSFSAYRRIHGRKTLTINWGAWKETGMAVDYGVSQGLTTVKALDAFEMAINKKTSRVIIADLDNNSKILYNIEGSLSSSNNELDLNMDSDITEDIQDAEYKNVKSHVKLKGRNTEDEYLELEKLLADIWCQLLGLDEISIYDDFFELGGNSIISIKIEAEAEKHNLNINFADIYKYPMIYDLAEYIEKEKNKNTNKSELPQEVDTLVNNAFEKQVKENIHIDMNDEASGKTIINGIEPFNDFFYKSCFYNSLFPIVKGYGKSIIPFLINNINIYKYIKNGCEENLEIGYISYKQEKDILSDLNIVVNEKADSRDIINDVIMSLKNKRPVVMWVDCFFESLRVDTYMTNHMSHTLLLYGYDKNDQLFYLIEHANKDNLTYKKRTISFKEASESYNGFLTHLHINKDIPTYHDFYLNKSEIDEKSNQQSKNEENILTFSKNINRSREQLFHGLECINQFKEYCRRVTYNRSEFYQFSNTILLSLNNVINAKQVEKYILSQVLVNKSMILDLFDTILSDWSFIRTNFVKCIYTKTFNTNVFASLLEKKLELIYLNEKRYYKILFRELTGIE